MPEKATVERARRDLRRGKAASTAAGEFVREEIEHIRHGKHGARSTKQAIAIGLSKARRAGVPLKVRNRQDAREEAHAGQKPSRTRSRAMSKALEKEPHRAASHAALSKHARAVAKRRRR
jgi:hypothetical protein